MPKNGLSASKNPKATKVRLELHKRLRCPVCQLRYTECRWCSHGQLTVSITGYWSWDVKSRCRSDYAIVAFDGDVLVGAFKYNWNARRRYLCNSQTWVKPSHRRTGLAKRLWQHALDYHCPKFVSPVVGTRRGAALVAALQETNPKVWFDVSYDYGDH